MTDLQNEVQNVVASISHNYKPSKIILFGSVAKNVSHSGSDIDLFIIKNTTQKRPLRVQNVFKSIRGLTRKYSLDPIVYTPKEVSKRLKLGDLFVTEVLKSGKVVYVQ